MCSLIIPSSDSKTRPFTSTTCPKDATLPNFEKTVLDKTSRRRVNSGSNTTTSCRRSAYVHIKKGYIGKDHCTLWNTFVVSSSVLEAAEDGRLASLLKVAVHLEAVVTRVGHCHVAVRREGQALGTIKGVRWCVNVGQEGPGAVEYLFAAEMKGQCVSHVLLKWSLSNQQDVVFLKLTWIRLLPQSATMIFPLASTATPVGALNCPFPSPWEPNLNRNSPSALYTWCKD